MKLNADHKQFYHFFVSMKMNLKGAGMTKSVSIKLLKGRLILIVFGHNYFVLFYFTLHSGFSSALSSVLILWINLDFSFCTLGPALCLYGRLQETSNEILFTLMTFYVPAFVSAVACPPQIAKVISTLQEASRLETACQLGQ